MKQHLLGKSGRNLLIAMLATLPPLTLVHAEDAVLPDSYDQTQNRGIPQTSEPETNQYGSQYGDDRNLSSEPRGPQGPMRSDMTSDQATEQQRAEQQRELQLRQEREMQSKKDDFERLPLWNHYGP